MVEVFAAIRGVDPVVEGGIGGLFEADILLDATGLDMAVAPLLRAAVPGGAVTPYPDRT